MFNTKMNVLLVESNDCNLILNKHIINSRYILYLARNKTTSLQILVFHLGPWGNQFRKKFKSRINKYNIIMYINVNISNSPEENGHTMSFLFTSTIRHKYQISVSKCIDLSTNKYFNVTYLILLSTNKVFRFKYNPPIIIPHITHVH